MRDALVRPFRRSVGSMLELFFSPLLCRVNGGTVSDNYWRVRRPNASNNVFDWLYVHGPCLGPRTNPEF